MQESIILMPGMNEQSNAFLKRYKFKDAKLLLIGTATPHLVKKLLGANIASLQIIVDNEDLLLNERLTAPKDAKIRIRYMDYANTDFADDTFDYIYSQGSTSTTQRVGILHEFKRILKPGGVLGLGELVYFREEIPVSIQNVWTDAGVSPVLLEKADAIYTDEGFTLLEKTDLSKTLFTLYDHYLEIMQLGTKKMPEDERHMLRHDLTRLKHEAEMFIKMGGDKYTGYFLYELQKAL